MEKIIKLRDALVARSAQLSDLTTELQSMLSDVCPYTLDQFCELALSVRAEARQVALDLSKVELLLKTSKE